MIAANLPPVADAIRASLLDPPTAAHGSLMEVPTNSEIAAFFRKHEAGVAKLGKVVDAHIAHVRSGISELQARVAAGEQTITLAAVETLIGSAETGLELDRKSLAEVEGSRSRVLALTAHLPIRPRLDRLFDRMRAHAERHHDALVEQMYRLRALASELDPDAQLILTRPSATSAATALRAALDIA